MTINPKIFKAYDIRGKEGQDLTPEFAKRLGGVYVMWLKKKINKNNPLIIVSHDVRELSPILAKNLAEGMSLAGADVVFAGESSTSMYYFVVNITNADGGIMVTASHNPKGDNGFKICLSGAVTVGLGGGLEEIQLLMESEVEFTGEKKGKIETKNFLNDYVNFLAQIKVDYKEKIVIDCANGAAGPIMEEILSRSNLNAEKLFFEADSNFPNHDPNPLKEGALNKLVTKIKEVDAELGIAFDADGDRAFFIKKDGLLVSADDIAIILSRYFLQKQKGENIVLDLRMSRKVLEEIKKSGGSVIINKVGHTFIKSAMRKHSAVFGAELSGHYYFKDFFFADGGVFAALMVLKVLAQTNKTLEEEIQDLHTYAKSEEMNFKIENALILIEKLKEKFKDGEQKNIDGLSVDYPDWWFNLRASNTEPLVRLVVEAKNKELLDEKIGEIKAIILG